MIEKTIFNFQGLELRVTDSANNGILNILDHAVQGSEGGMRFSFLNIRERIAAYKNHIRFISLYKNHKITATVGACFRISGEGSLKYPSTFIKYLAFHSLYQSDIKTRRKKPVKEIKPEPFDSFKSKTLELFGKPHLLDLPDVSENDKHILYAFFESMNERAKNLVHQAGFDYIRSFLTVAFSRFNPKTDGRVSKLEENKIPEMRNLLKDYYCNYSLFTSEYAFYGNKYYVLKEDGEIIAGVSAIPTSNKVYDIPGVWGWVMMKVLPYAPYFRRLFSPGVFRFLVFDAIYCRKGRESHLYSLFESVCASEGFNTALMWLDDRSEFYDKIRIEGHLGALNRMLNAKPGLVYIKFVNLTEEEKDKFYDAPAYVSGFDFS